MTPRNPAEFELSGQQDERWYMLLPLVHAQVISMDELHKIMNWSNVDDGPDVLFGYVAGEFNKTPNEIAAGLEGSEYSNYDTADIEVMERGYYAAYGDFMRGVVNLSDQVDRGLARMPGAITDFWGRNLLDPEEKQENLTRLDGIKRDQPRMHEWLDQVIADGDLRPEDIKEYRNAIDEWSAFDSVKGESSTTYDNPVFEMIEKFEDMGYVVPPGIETTALQDILDERNEASKAEAGDAERNLTPQQVQAMADRYGSGFESTGKTPDFDYSSYSFSEVMTMLGLSVATIKATIAEGEEEAFDLLAEGYDFTDEGVIFDRATGVGLTRDILEVLKHDAAAREAYSATAPHSSEVDRLFESGYINMGKVPRYDSEGNVVRNSEGDIVYEYFEKATGGYFLAEDFAIPTAVADDPWERDLYMYGSPQDQDFEWFGMSPRSQNLWMDQMVNNGLIHENQANLPYDDGVVALWRDISSVSEYRQLPRDLVMNQFGDTLAAERARAPRGPSGSGRIAPKYSVPASLREIPDYKTLATQSRALFSQEVGREMEDWELAILADELKEKYEDEQTSKIGIHKEAWDEGLAGGSVNVDFSEVTNPLQAQQYDTRETYADEIDRQARVEDRANNNRLLMNSITVGSRMI